MKKRSCNGIQTANDLIWSKPVTLCFRKQKQESCKCFLTVPGATQPLQNAFCILKLENATEGLD